MSDINLREKPSLITLWVLLLTGILIFVVVRILMTPYFNEYPVSFIESQLSFSGEEIKGHFAQMNSESIALYKIGNLLDYIYMIGYGLMMFAGSVIFLRVYPEASFGEKIGKIFAITGIIAPLCDAIENVFILIMITNPASFPNYIAILHSIFAVIKFGLIIIGWLYFIISFCVWITQIIKNQKKN